MKKLIIITLFLLFSLYSQSQEVIELRINKTRAEIKKEVPSIKIEKDNTGEEYYLQTGTDVICKYYFDDEGLCYVQQYLYLIDSLPTIIKTLNEEPFIKIKNLQYMLVLEDYSLEYLVYIGDKVVILNVFKL